MGIPLLRAVPFALHDTVLSKLMDSLVTLKFNQCKYVLYNINNSE